MERLKKEDIIEAIMEAGISETKKGAGESVQLKDGKLYICPIQAYIDIFNEKFNDNFVINKEDFLDIYDENVTGKTIKGFYYKKNGFCDYCRKPIENQK